MLFLYKNYLMNPIIRITKEFTFEMAHVLDRYDGPCSNIHGHSYRLCVTVSGIPINDKGSPKEGMVMDFSDIKKIVTEKILNIFDHSIAVSKGYIKDNMSLMGKALKNMVVLDYQPTCENLVTDFASRLKNSFPDGVSLHSLRLYETPISFAEWFASDN